MVGYKHWGTNRTQLFYIGMLWGTNMTNSTIFCVAGYEQNSTISIGMWLGMNITN